VESEQVLPGARLLTCQAMDVQITVNAACAAVPALEFSTAPMPFNQDGGTPLAQC
jgi:hypothetical protein